MRGETDSIPYQSALIAPILNFNLGTLSCHRCLFQKDDTMS